jgi:serine/threonine protein phosphatase PrpC
MSQTANTWRVIGASVQGASHIRRNKPNQDSIYPEFSGGAYSHRRTPCVMAVSDGHGGAKYVRSGAGSLYAAMLAAQAALYDSVLYANLKEDEIEETIYHLKVRFFNMWACNVDEDLSLNPLTMDALADLDDKSAADVLANPRKAYGCTLLWVIGYDDLVITMWLGDGNILLLYENGIVESVQDLSKMDGGNATQSLCSLQSPQEIQHRVFKNKPLPVVVTASTDGLYNSYADDSAFLAIPPVCLEELINSDLDIVRITRRIDRFLRRVTNNGIGDDTTLGIMFDRSRISSLIIERESSDATC